MTGWKTRSAAMGLAVALVLPVTASAQALVFVTRHAERADGGSMAATAEKDPKLSAAGAARAAALASLLAGAGIKGIYATEFHRTQDTAQPLAAALHLTTAVVPADDTTGLIARIKRDHPRDIVLIVVHSNTLPDVVAAFGGPKTTVPDDAYGDLFVVVPGTGVMSRLKY